MDQYLTNLIMNGRKLLTVQETEQRAYQWFFDWDHTVASWVRDNLGPAQLAAWSAIQWPAQPSSSVVKSLVSVSLSIQKAAALRMDWLARHAVVSVSEAQDLPIPATVFIVHGRDTAMRESAARYIERFKLEVVILHEQPNQGRTIIEKFTDHADVGFAVVLLTGDDRGGLFDEPYETQRPRARQNVLFELGYFLGLLNRQRVCALYSPGVEIPSDYQGVLFIPADEAGAWKLQLAKEMKAAGLPVDMNDA
ncbi:MAG: nucleotide-binding protein [Phycisphaerales bacterium]